jgi:hypothetical protein
MRTITCDCCGNKIEGRVYEFNPLCNDFMMKGVSYDG